MKQQIFTRLLCLVLVLVCALPALAWAEDTSRSYDFDLSVGGQQEVRAATGETVTVTLVLKRTDRAESAEMYGMQTEILYDDSFFKLVEGSIMTAPGVRWSDMGRRTGGRAFYLNFVSFSGGEPWASEVTVGSFQMEVIGTKGVSSLTPENSIVSVQSGTDHYTMTDNPVTVIVTTDCTVTFESAGGSGGAGGAGAAADRQAAGDVPDKRRHGVGDGVCQARRRGGTGADACEARRDV